MKNKLKILFGIAFLFMVFFYACNSNNQNETPNEAAKIDVKKLEQPQFDYISEGKKIAGEAQSVLGKNLMNAISSKGTKYAVEFCNIEAIPITDSMAKFLGASVKRVTNKPRNPNNLANGTELSYINRMKADIQNGETAKSLMVETNGKMVGYYPIVTNAMCLKCHGDKDVTIEPETYKKIKTLYPSDKATGYAANELRGMLVVEMKKK